MGRYTHHRGPKGRKDFLRQWVFLILLVCVVLLSVKYGASPTRSPEPPELLFKITGRPEVLVMKVKRDHPLPAASGKIAAAQGRARDGQGALPNGFFMWGGVLILLCLIWLIYKKRKREEPRAVPTQNYIEPNGALPGLSGDFEARLFSNFQELSMVESNLFCNKPEGLDVKTIYISSCFNGEGKTLAAINMAFALTINANSRVLLVDGNPRAPVLHRLFNIEETPGLINLFQDPAPAGAVIRETRYKNLCLAPFGVPDTGRPNLVKENRLKKINARLLEGFDYLIFDGNSLIGSSDSVMVASNFDGIVIVVEAENTKWGVVQSVVEKMSAAGVQVIGTVLNKRKYYIPRCLYGKI